METPHRTGGSAAEPPPLTQSDASLLVGLIDGLTAAARQGESLDVEALAGEHPRLAGELHSLWATSGSPSRCARPEKPGRPTGDQPVQVPPTDSSAGRSASSPGPVFFGDYQLFVEWLLGLPVLSLITMIAVTNGMLFMVKAGILSGFYHFQAAAVMLAIPPMAWFPRFAPLIFGTVAAACFFVTGLKYRSRRQLQRALSARCRDRRIPQIDMRGDNLRKEL